MKSSISAIRRVFASLKKSDEGTIAIIFALVLIPIVGITATAVDYGRASRVKSAISRAADAAVREVATSLHRPDDVIEQEIRKQLDANLPTELQGIAFEMQVPSNRSYVEIKLESSVNTTLAAVLGVMKLDLVVNAKADRVTRPTNGKVTPEMVQDAQKKLRKMIDQAQQTGALGADGSGFRGGGGIRGRFPDYRGQSD